MKHSGRNTALLCLCIACCLTLLPSCNFELGERDAAESTTASSTGATTEATTEETTAQTLAPLPPVDKTRFYVSVGDREFVPICCFIWSESYYEEMDAWICGDGVGFYGLTKGMGGKTLDDVPVAKRIGESALVNVPTHWEIVRIEAHFCQDGTVGRTGRDIGKELSAIDELEAGEWYISITVISQGQYIEKDDKYERYCDSYVFKLIVD